MKQKINEQQRKSMKPNWFFKQTYKIDKPSARLIKIKRKTQITNIKYERVATIDPTDLTRLIGKYYEELHDDKFNNLDKMGKFLERHKQPKHTQEETDNMNSLISIFFLLHRNISPISIKEIEFVV